MCLLAVGCEPEPLPDGTDTVPQAPVTVIDTLPPDTVWVSPPYDTAAAREGRVWRRELHGPTWFKEGNTVQLRQKGYVITTTLLGENRFRTDVFNNMGTEIEGFVDGMSFRYILRNTHEILPDFVSDADTTIVILPLDAPAEANTTTDAWAYGACCYLILDHSDTSATIVIPSHTRMDMTRKYFCFTKITR